MELQGTPIFIGIDAIDIPHERLLNRGFVFVGTMSDEDIRELFDLKPDNFAKLTRFDRTAMQRLGLE